MSRTTTPRRTWLFGAALALLTGASCTDPLDPQAQHIEAPAMNVETKLNPQPEPPSMFMLPYILRVLVRGEFDGTLGSCDVVATLELGDPQGEVTPLRWNLALTALDGGTFDAELSGILNWTTGHSVSNGVLTLPAVQFRIHEHGTFTADETGPTIFAGAVALNPQPEPPSYPPNPFHPPNPSHPPNPFQPPNPLGQNPCAVAIDR